MKIKKFVSFIKETLLKRADVDIKTVQMILQELILDLSESEKEREKDNILALMTITTQQITLSDVVNREKTNHLERELNILKNGNIDVIE